MPFGSHGRFLATRTCSDAARPSACRSRHSAEMAERSGISGWKRSLQRNPSCIRRPRTRAHAGTRTSAPNVTAHAMIPRRPTHAERSLACLFVFGRTGRGWRRAAACRTRPCRTTRRAAADTAGSSPTDRRAPDAECRAARYSAQLAAGCSGLQRVAACCNVLQRVATCCSGVHRVATGCNVLQRGAT